MKLLFAETEHQLLELEKLAQRFTGVTESVEEFERRIERESKQRKTVNRTLLDWKRQQDNEQDRIRRGLSPQEAELEKEKEKKKSQQQRKLLKKQGGELDKLDKQMRLLTDSYQSNKQ